MSPRPNLLIVNFHDLGRHLGCYGRASVRSPNLDRLAADGWRFDRAFASAPQCSPSRASLVTGRQPHCNGVLGLTHAWFRWDLHREEVHLAQHLGALGYHTAQVGIMHETRRPDEMGYAERLQPASWDAPGMVDAAIGVLETRSPADGPWALYIGLKETHRGFGDDEDRSHGVELPGYLAHDEATERDFAQFQACIQRADAEVGRLLTALDASPHAADTLVIVTTDHGIPMNRAKCTLHDAGLETALLLRWPAGGITGGRVCDQLIGNVDILPTLLELLGAGIPADIQGRSFAPLLRGEPYEPNDAVFGELTYHNYCDPRRSIRTDRHRLIVNFTAAPFFMPSGGDAKLGYRAPGYHEPVELYDLETDPDETTDLARDEDHAAVRRELLARLHRWMQETADPLLQGIPTPPMHQLACQALRSGEVPD